jgi:ferredoxin
MKARIHRELCVGVKNYVAMAPGYFEMDEYGLARVIKANMVGQGESASAPRRG